MFTLAIIAIVISIKSYKNANRQFEENSRKSDSIFKIQLELTNTQINISDQLLKDQINSDSPQIIVVTTTLEAKNILIEGMYEAVIDITFKNSGKRNAHNVLFRTFAITADFSAVFQNIGYSGNNSFVGPDQENAFNFSPKFDKPITSLYFCYEITYIDKLTGKKNGYTNFKYSFQNNRGDDQFGECNYQISNKLKKLINSILIN